ncbi:redox-regulated ATPase YchF, partial [Frankia sp. Mgl5]|nr:redox-regulated ATPase YchF [Frankia sp. Mgl5]
ELVFADLDSVERRIERIGRKVKAGDREAKQELDVLERLRAAFEEGHPARSVELDEEEQKLVHDLHLLTIKPLLYVCNVAEDGILNAEENPHVQA